MASRAPTMLSPLFSPTLYTRVQTLWFATQPTSNPIPTPSSTKRWFYDPDRAAAAAFDAQLSDECLPALRTLFPARHPLPPASSWADEQAQAAQLAAPFLPTLDDGGGDDSAALGLVLLLDQVSRNTLRQDAGVVYGHLDRVSRAVARAVLARGADRGPRLRADFARRQWFYLPFMHSEYLEDHEFFGSRVEELTRDVMGGEREEELRKALDRQTEFEAKHVAILRRFGRYPHRNRALGRETTEEEREWLDNGGDTFGA